jgi:hypothetical protein
LAMQTTDPAVAEETADCAAEVLETVLVHSLGGGGMTASTVQPKIAGVASTLPAASVALTEN